MKKILVLALATVSLVACTGQREEVVETCSYDMAARTKTCDLSAAEYTDMATPVQASGKPTVVGTRTINGTEFLVMSDQKLIPVDQATAHAK